MDGKRSAEKQVLCATLASETSRSRCLTSNCDTKLFLYVFRGTDSLRSKEPLSCYGSQSLLTTLAAFLTFRSDLLPRYIKCFFSSEIYSESCLYNNTTAFVIPRNQVTVVKICLSKIYRELFFGRMFET
jgi:hypothetical protein